MTKIRRSCTRRRRASIGNTTGADRGAAMRARFSTSRFGCTTPGLDKAAAYKLRIVYTGDMFQVKVRLVAGDSSGNPSLPAEAPRHDAAGIRSARER